MRRAYFDVSEEFMENIMGRKFSVSDIEDPYIRKYLEERFDLPEDCKIIAAFTDHDNFPKYVINIMLEAPFFPEVPEGEACDRVQLIFEEVKRNRSSISLLQISSTTSGEIYWIKDIQRGENG